MLWSSKDFWYTLKGVLHMHWVVILGMNNTLLIAWTKYSAHGVYKIRSWGYCFPSKFELCIFGSWKRCKTRIFFLIISLSIHIRICENVILTINTRWCKNKIKCFTYIYTYMSDTCYKNVFKMPRFKQTHHKMGNMS